MKSQNLIRRSAWATAGCCPFWPASRSRIPSWWPGGSTRSSATISARAGASPSSSGLPTGNRNGGLRFLCGQLGITISGDDDAALKTASKAVQKRLKPWRDARHYGYQQTEMHAVTGWFLERNILQIERDAELCTGPKESALNATHCPALYPQLIIPFACAQWECVWRRSWTRTATRSRTIAT